jgi:hypothetical protein
MRLLPVLLLAAINAQSAKLQTSEGLSAVSDKAWTWPRISSSRAV